MAAYTGLWLRPVQYERTARPPGGGNAQNIILHIYATFTLRQTCGGEKKYRIAHLRYAKLAVANGVG